MEVSLAPRVEGAANPEDLVGLVPDRDDVETDGPRARRVRREPAARGANYARTFPESHRFGRRPQRIIPPPLHFSEDDNGAVESDDVDLAVGIPDISGENDERVFFE